MSFLPVNEPLLDGNEKRYLTECIDSGWISSEGPFVKQFEKKFSDYIGAADGVAVSNGTAALEVALYGLGVSKDDEVILPSFTIVSCALAVLRLGAKPVLVDIDPETWCMDVNQVERKISKRTKVIMAVHMYGHPVDMDPLLVLREKYNLKILEDAAQVHGAEYYSEAQGAWLKCGSIGDASAFSFYANKIVTTGEGGMVLSKDSEVIDRARSYRNLCFVPEQRFHHEDVGYNFRITNLQAAVGLAQVERLDEFVAIKRHLGALYRDSLAGMSGLRFQPEKPWARSVYWMYSVELKPEFGLDANVAMQRLAAQGIGTRPFFKGLHLQPAFQNLGLFIDEVYPSTEFAYRFGFYLPSGLTLREHDVELVCQKLKQIME